MAKYKPKDNMVDAIQFTGDNWNQTQKFAGKHAVDAQGVYMVPNFDVVENWWPANTDPEVTAVLWNGSQWLAVKPTNWLVRDENNVVSIMLNDEFHVTYDSVSDPAFVPVSDE